MSNSSTNILGVGPVGVDTEALAVPVGTPPVPAPGEVVVVRQRVQVVGAAAGAIAEVKATEPTGMEQALVVRMIPGLATQPTIESRSASADVNPVPASVSSTQLLAANTSRRGAIIYNDSTSVLYLKLGVDASTTSFTVKLGAGGYMEVPFPGYTGEVSGIWLSAVGNALVTEFS